jgi:class 3 adenylate cyclase
LAHAETLQGIPLPGQLSDILRRRLAARSPAEVAILEVFAAAGRPLDLWLLARLVLDEEGGGDELFAHVDALRVHDLVGVDGEVVAVRHDRILEFTYEGMSPERRREVHDRIGAVMVDVRESEPDRYAFPDGEIGMQFLRGGESSRAVGHLLVGGRQAFRVQALDEAVRLLEPAEQALIGLGDDAVGGRLDDVQDLLMRALYAESPTRALPVAERTLARHREVGLMARVPALRRRLGVFGLIIGLLGTFVALKRKHKGFDKERFLGVIRRFLVFSAWHAQGLAWASRFTESLAVAERLEAYAPGRSLATLAARIAGSAALMHQGRFREQAVRLDDAYALAMSKAGDALAPFDKRVMVRGAIGGGRAMAGIWQGDPDLLRQFELEDGVTEDVEPIILEGLEATVRVSFHASRGEARAMHAEFRRYLESRAIKRPEEREEAEHWLAVAAIERGEFERAKELADGFVHRGSVSDAWRALVRARLLQAPLSRIAAAEEAISAATRPGQESPLLATYARLVLADGHLDAGVPARARKLLGEVLEFSRDEDHLSAYLESMALRRLAEVALVGREITLARQHAADALELSTALRNPIQRGLCLRTSGAIEAAALQHAEADRCYSQAAVEFEQLDNGYELKRLRDLAGDQGVSGGTMYSSTLNLSTGIPFALEGIQPSTAVALVSSLDVDHVVKATLAELADRLPEHTASILLPSGENRPSRVLSLDGGGELEDIPDGIPLPVLEVSDRLLAPGVGRTAVSGGGWIVPLAPTRELEEGEQPPVALLYLPPEPHRIGEATVVDFAPLLSISAAALANALAHEDLRQREYRLTLMHQLGQVLGAVRDHQDLISVILDRMIDVGQADRAFIMLKDAESGELEFAAGRTVDRATLTGRDFAVSRTAIREALDTGGIVHIDDEETLKTKVSVAALSLKSVTVVPLLSIVSKLAEDPVEVDKAQQTLLAVDPHELGELLGTTRTQDAEIVGVVYLESRRFYLGAGQDRSLLRLLAHQAGFAIDISRLQERLIKEAAEQERLHQRQKQLSRYLSADVAEAVMDRPELMHLGGAHRDISVMFTDVRGFTKWSSKRSPEEVVAALNRIFSLQSEILFRHGGTLDKFLGDGLMALFGAPIGSEDHARRAVAAAVEIQEAMAKLLPELEATTEGAAIGGIGIGIHTGIAAVGNIGSDLRMEYTAIGNTVNLASRLCGLASAGQILLTTETSEQSGLTDAQRRLIPPVAIKGKDEPIPLVEALVGEAT